MQWHNLLFMHWPLPPRMLSPLIPAPLRLDTFEGAAWMGVAPFQMRGVGPRLIPPLPGLSAFCELNVRTYVTFGGKPGVWFFSLDAASGLAVRAARLAFHLPYYDARMRCETRGQTIRYTSSRVHRLAPPAGFAASYRPIGPPVLARPGDLADWLTARYCLYAADRHGTVWRGDIDHAPWPLQPAEAEIEKNTMVAPLRVILPSGPPLLHFARRLDVVAWNLEVVHASL
ncbi:MAG TPA: DUF2071 domain-containing protein [Chloroflexota bacterium]|nr:DUF2071 domain-containing protein [Chloroflexota bacterium]